MNQSKMLGNTRSAKQAGCNCCLPLSWRKVTKRSMKRTERQAWKKDLSNI